MQQRLFSPLNINQWPVRAAFDIGNAGCVTVTVARVDARRGAIRDTLYHNALPIAAPASGSAARAAESDVLAKTRLLLAAVRGCRPAEWTAALSGPWARSGAAAALARTIGRELGAACAVRDAEPPHHRFLQHAAAAQHLSPTRLLVLAEGGAAEGNALGLLGATAVDGGEAVAVRAAALPPTAAEAHRVLCVELQRRDAAAYSGAMSPNPVLPGEFRALRAAMEGVVARALPPWATATADAGGLLVGTGANGGVLNVMARAAGQSTMSVERVEQAAEHHLCRLGDVLLGENYPYPAVLLPQLALGCAVCRALRIGRLRYLPDVAPTHLLLVTPGLWAHSRAHELAARLEADPGLAAQRFFERPHQAGASRFDPNAPSGDAPSPTPFHRR